MRFSRTRIIVLKRSSSNFAVYFLDLAQTSKPIFLLVVEFIVLKTFMNSCLTQIHTPSSQRKWKREAASQNNQQLQLLKLRQLQNHVTDSSVTFPPILIPVLVILAAEVFGNCSNFEFLEDFMPMFFILRLIFDVNCSNVYISPSEHSNEDQENQMNTVNIKDSMSQTEKWFDAISPSSSKSDILSNSFAGAGTKQSL